MLRLTLASTELVCLSRSLTGLLDEHASTATGAGRGQLDLVMRQAFLHARPPAQRACIKASRQHHIRE